MDWNTSIVYYAGYFADYYTEEEHDFLNESAFLRNRTLDILRDFFKNKEKPTLNILIGCFAPFHEGHKETITRCSNENTFSLIIPAHDSYIKEKIGFYPLDKRVDSIKSLMKGQGNWIIETTPADDFLYEVNFPYILNYILKNKKRINENLSINFLLGDDNAGFALALENTGITPIIFLRKNVGNIIKIQNKLKELNSTVEPVYILDSVHKDLSSRDIR